ncbi:MAG: alanine--glyoxylate aminotransferase family protein [Zavarzinella sp.]
MNLKLHWNTPNRLLLGPGPSDAHPRVLRAMATPLLGHLDPAFLTLLNETQELLRQVLGTTNPLTLPISATGMAGMETCLVNLAEKSERILIFRKGFFGSRMVEIAQRVGGEVVVIDAPWGEVFSLETIEAAIVAHKPQIVGIVHAENSTGAQQPLEGIGELCHRYGALLLVDAVTSLGCTPINMDENEIDALYSCTQKGLGCPPGLSPVSFSPRAAEKIAKRTTKPQSWYFDLQLINNYVAGDRLYHHTAPISMIYALREGLAIVLEEGLETRYQRHRLNHLALKAGLTALGCQYSANPEHGLPQLNAVYIPAGVNDVEFRKQLLNYFGIEIGGGLGEFKGKVWRIGLMGYNSKPAAVYSLLNAMEVLLLNAGISIIAGSASAAATKVYAEQMK